MYATCNPQHFVQHKLATSVVRQYCHKTIFFCVGGGGGGGGALNPCPNNYDTEVESSFWCELSIGWAPFHKGLRLITFFKYTICHWATIDINRTINRKSLWNGAQFTTLLLTDHSQWQVMFILWDQGRRCRRRRPGLLGVWVLHHVELLKLVLQRIRLLLLLLLIVRIAEQRLTHRGGNRWRVTRWTWPHGHGCPRWWEGGVVGVGDGGCRGGTRDSRPHHRLFSVVLHLGV